MTANLAVFELAVEDMARSLAFRCESPDAVDQLYGELVAAGHEGHKEPWDAVWGMRYAMVHDPDGNGVDLFSPTSG